MKKEYGKRRDYPTIKIAENTYMISDFKVANCYLLVGNERALLIDCGTGLGDLRGYVETLTDKPLDVVVTHIHTDHMGGMGQFEKIYAHIDDIRFGYRFWTSILVRKFFTLGSKGIIDNTISIRDIKKSEVKSEVIAVEDGHIFDLGDRRIRVIHSKGHTRGSIILIDEKTKILFAGDNACPSPWLFLPNASSVEEWIESAKEIVALSQTHTLYWGHESGTLTAELLEHVVSIGEEILNMYPKNKKFSKIVFYPSNDRVNGSLVFRTGNVRKK